MAVVFVARDITTTVCHFLFNEYLVSIETSIWRGRQFKLPGTVENSLLGWTPHFSMFPSVHAVGNLFASLVGWTIFSKSAVIQCTLIIFLLNNKANFAISPCGKCLVDLPRKTLSTVHPLLFVKCESYMAHSNKKVLYPFISSQKEYRSTQGG